MLAHILYYYTTAKKSVWASLYVIGEKCYDLQQHASSSSTHVMIYTNIKMRSTKQEMSQFGYLLRDEGKDSKQKLTPFKV